MNSTVVVVCVSFLITTAGAKASMSNHFAYPEQKGACEKRNLRYDKAAQAKKARRVQNRQWTMCHMQRQPQPVQQQALANNASIDDQLCSGSCGCLGRDKRSDCLASGYPIPLIGYMLKLFGF